MEIEKKRLTIDKGKKKKRLSHANLKRNVTFLGMSPFNLKFKSNLLIEDQFKDLGNADN